MNLCVIGTGYVGLVTGAVFADLGNEVTCVDSDKEKIANLRKGKLPIFEPGLEEIVDRNLKEGRLDFTEDLAAGVMRAEVVFICVGTPPDASGGTNLGQVEEAARGIARAMNGYKIVVNKSTVPVGTGDLVRSIIEETRNGDADFDVVSNPEFLREGSAIQDTLVPDRIVIGAPNRQVAMKLLELYSPLERPMIVTDVSSAEIIKYASNAFLATRISFINAIADLCEVTGADISLVAKGMGQDHRIGPHFLQAGLGYGGSCFPKDVESLIHTCRGWEVPFRLLEEVHRINRERIPKFFSKILARFDGSLAGKTFGVLGLAFKPNTDDLREARSLDLIFHLLQHGATVRAYDPVAMEKTRAIFPQITYCQNAYETAEGADALVLVTEWREFQFLNLPRLKEQMKSAVLFDGRNFFDPDRPRRAGFEIHGVGRP
jgi:UDPglucose 6-dehydrogenase